MERLHRSAVNMVSNLLGWVAPIIVNLVATPFLLHGLGPDAYGLQNLVGVIVGYFVIMDMGLDIAGVKLLAEYHSKVEIEAENRLLNTNLQIYGLIGLTGMVLILLLAKSLATHVFQVPVELRSQAITVFRLGAIGFLTSMVIAWGGTICIGLQRYGIKNSISLLNNVIGVSAGVLVVYAGYGVIGFVLTRVITASLTGLVYFLFTPYLLPAFQLHFGIDWEMVRRFGSMAMYGLILRITGILTTSIDRTLIGMWLGTKAVAFYAIPNLIAVSLGQLVPQMMHFLFPMVSELSSVGEHEKLRDIFIKSSRFIFSVSTMAFLPVFVLADLLLALWVGQEIAVQSASVFRLLLIASYLSSFSILAGSIVPGLGHFKQLAIYASGKSLIIAIGCISLIRPLGIAGAGVAVLLGGLVDLLFTIFSLQYYLQIRISKINHQIYMPLALVGIISGGLPFLARPLASSWLGLGAILGFTGLIFLTISYTLGIFGETEKRVLSQVIRAAEKLLLGRTALR